MRYALPAKRYYCAKPGWLEILCGHPVANVKEAVLAARELIAQGPEVVLVKHLSRAGLSMDRFEVLLVTSQEASHQPSAGGFRHAPAGGRRRCHQRAAVG